MTAEQKGEPVFAPPIWLILLCTPILAAAHQIRGSVRDTALCDKPSASLWLAKAYVVPAGMYGCQVWSSGTIDSTAQ